MSINHIFFEFMRRFLSWFLVKNERQKRTIAALFRTGLKTVAIDIWYLWHHDLFSIIALFRKGLKTIARNVW